VTAPEGAADVRARPCSLVARSERQGPLGSARAGDHLFVEVPLPWPREIRAAAMFPPSVEAALKRIGRAHGAEPRVLGIVPDPVESVPGAIRLLAFRRGDGPAAGFARSAAVLPPADSGAFVEHAFSAATGVAPPGGAAGTVRDLFVCTHGSRDRCCARFGYPVYEALRRTAAGAAGAVRVWRTSHTGGHRFAPTMIEMPAGRYWGHLDDGAAEAVAGQRGPVKPLLSRYRGRSLVPPLAQLVEAELFAAEGWAWDEVRVDASVDSLAESPAGRIEAALVRLAVVRPDGSAETVERRGVADGTIRTGGCGKPAGAEPRYRVIAEPSRV
jgi:hypothetical protein